MSRQSKPSANMRPTSAASARTRPSKTASACGSLATTSERARHSTPCRSRNCSAASICRRRLRSSRALRRLAPVSQQLVPDQLEHHEVLGRHLQAFERGDFVQVEEEVALEGVAEAALDESYRDQPFPARDRLDLVQG